jgi:starch synthase
MDILQVSSELAPFAKVGGLADVVSALGKALRQLGHKVTLAMPRYPALERGGLLVARRLTPLAFEMGGKQVEVTVYDGRLGSGVELVLFDVPGLYDRQGIYGEGGTDYADNARRFALLSRAAAELVRQRSLAGSGFDAVHVHDWPAALAAVYLKEMAKGGLGPVPAVVLTIHNVAHQGVFPKDVLPSLGLGWDLFHPGYLEFYGKLNVLKAGVLAAHKVTTVSATYAREIQSGDAGCGLQGVIATRAADVIGITNGIDYSTWNPATDAALVARYDAEDTANKARCKSALLREIGLSVSDGPLVLHVGRLVAQKGADLTLDVAAKLVHAGATVVVAGDGDPGLVSRARDTVAPLAGRAAFLQGPDEPTVHRAFAAADLVLVPSRFEPCGLVQQYAQRYGALPVVHATGGLCDTVVDCDSSLETGTGFVFSEPTAQALLGAAERALGACASARWPVLRRRVMRLDIGWDRPARRYEQLFRSATAGR